MKLWRKVLDWFRGWFKPRQLFVLVWPGIQAAVADTVNDTRLQSLALEAVKSAVELGLGGDEAWNVAFARFQSDVAQLGKEFGRSMLDTILQSAYFAYKNGGAK